MLDARFRESKVKKINNILSDLLLELHTVCFSYTILYACNARRSSRYKFKYSYLIIIVKEANVNSLNINVKSKFWINLSVYSNNSAFQDRDLTDYDLWSIQEVSEGFELHITRLH